MNYKDVVVVGKRFDVGCLGGLRELPCEIGISPWSINVALVELGLVRLAIHLGIDNVGPVGRGPYRPGDTADV